MTSEILYVGEEEVAGPGGIGMSSDEWEVEATNSPGGESGGDVCWDGEAWSVGLGEIRRRDSSSCASEEENGRAPVSEGVDVPCSMAIVTKVE
jgi:hypothetical protein